MSDATRLAEVTNQIQNYWAPIFTKKWVETLLLAQLVNKDYEGQIKKGGDTVRVSQIVPATGENRTVGTDADSFKAEKLTTAKVDVKADKRAVASYKFEDLVDLQSQIDIEGSEVRDSLMYAMSKQVNDYLYSLVGASSSSPTHLVSSCSDLGDAQIKAIRVLAGQSKWPTNKPWYALLDPQYYMDAASGISSSLDGAMDSPKISGLITLKRYGFTCIEDTSNSADHGLFFHPDFLHFVRQQNVRVKISDLHSNEQFGYLLSVDIVYGAKLGIDGDEKHIQVYNSAWSR